MVPLKKRRNTPKLPLALNPQKSKDVLAVLAERNLPIVPVGAWVEPASPHTSENTAYTEAYIIEEKLKEQARKKQEALKRSQRLAKHRVNQRISIRKKQQLQKSSEEVKEEDTVAMLPSDRGQLTSKRTSVFPKNLNAASGSAWLSPSQKLDDGIENRENQNQLLQQALALKKTMKQARYHLASFKTMSKKFSAVFPRDIRESFSTDEEPDSEESSSITVDKKGREKLLRQNQQGFPSEKKNEAFSRGQKAQFKNPLCDVIEEEQLSKLHPQDALPETQDYLSEDQDDLLETQGDLTGVQSVELEAQNIKPHSQAVELAGQPMEDQVVESKAQAIERKVHVFKVEPQYLMLEAGNVEPEDGNMLGILSPNQAFLPKDQSILPSDQNIPLKCQDQHFLRKDQHFFPKDQDIQPKYQDQDFIPRFQKVRFKEHYSVINEKGRDDFCLASYQSPTPKVQDQMFIRDQNMFFKQPSSFLKEVGVRDEYPMEYHHYVNPQVQDHASPGDQSLDSRQQPSLRTAERRQDMFLDGHQHLPAKHQREASSRRQVYDKYQSGWNTEFQTPLGLQFEVNQEEDKKERQKRYLRYRRLFMDIEREKVKEQQRQKEYRKRIEKIKRKKEQQRYAEEQRLLRRNFQEEPYSGEMSEMLAQLQLEEMKEAREKQQRREREYQRYLEALRVQIREKMQLYNITLPPLCGCGPDFWDAHPNTCANNCIFYKNHRAYTRALYSVINSCDTPRWTLSLRAAIHNFASAYRRTLKYVYLESEINC
ncbi:coiled-coil domain-containing protein 15 isoform X2 [Pipistrellus kuhlii]|uniref:coiled-coil domain-containing protein 15 isoform X2 n=1 Tax=Pipistrellus kuhlii TaxID=59472 RepID=UPI00174F1819|nr:coiled-coil domain-containing protein 15 isoform X2 [Pipistrellus kuhlii]